MNFHPSNTLNLAEPTIIFAQRNQELVLTQKFYRKEEFPSLKETLVKIVGSDGSNIFIPLRKLSVNTSEM